ncbi:MAG: hypothetical protein AAGD09_03845 [Cyanobacteria bacterium P01_F01_bin.56]
MLSWRLFRTAGFLFLTLLLLGVGTLLHPAPAQTPHDEQPVAERLNTYLAEARIEQGAADLAMALTANPDDDELRFGTGILQFVGAVENLGQAWYEYGLRSQGPLIQFVPFLRLPVPPNPNPSTVTHEQSRQVLNQFVADILLAEETLAQISDDDVTLDVYLGRAFLDFDSDGQASPAEALWQIYAELNRGVQISASQAADFLIRFDAGDVQWLRGYCHLLAAMLDFYLAHDDTRLFEHVAHLFFQRPETSYDFLLIQQPEDWFDGLLSDAIALVHLISLPVIDRDRTAAALSHLQQVVTLSHQSWDLYSQETDNDHEWIPYPGQTGVIPGATVTLAMVNQWQDFLDEASAILAGERLLPFWRGTAPVGVNLRRVFTEPHTFDAVRWAQGTAAAPYLESGTITDSEFWFRLRDAFDGRFLFFAFWFN